MAREWRITPGTITTRSEVQYQYGGGPQGGIVPSRKSANLMIYSDPSKGHQYGYIDGWLPDEDEDGPVFEYTGHGESDQTFAGMGNRAIRDHVADGRAIRVFKAVGRVPGSDTKRQRYIGQFALDKKRPYIARQQPNRAGEPRRVIVFRLRPTGDDYERRAEDVVPLATNSSTITVPADVSISTLIEPEAYRTPSSKRAAPRVSEAERREARLSEDFRQFMARQGHNLQRFQIQIAGLSTPLLTDLYDPTAHVLYELKGNASRESIRMAIGQLLDYARHVNPAKPRLAVLLPHAPADDLKDLLQSLDITLVYADGTSFVDVPE